MTFSTITSTQSPLASTPIQKETLLKRLDDKIKLTKVAFISLFALGILLGTTTSYQVGAVLLGLAFIPGIIWLGLHVYKIKVGNKVELK